MNLTENTKYELISSVYSLMETCQQENDAYFKEIRDAYMPLYNKLYDRLSEDREKRLLEEIFSIFGEIYSIELMCSVLNGIKFLIDNQRIYTAADGKLTDLAIADVFIKNKEYANLCIKADSLQNELKLMLNDNQCALYNACRSKYIEFQDYSVGNAFKITGEILSQLRKDFIGE